MLLNTQTAARKTIIPKAKTSWTSRFAAFACGAYLLAIVAAAVVLWTLSDQWWPATVLLFAPRWVLSLPLIVLVPLAAVFHRKSLVVLGVAGLVLTAGLLGYCYSLDGTSRSKPEAGVRLLSCNIHRSQLDVEAFKKLIDTVSPDAIVLQDWTSSHEELLFGDSRWHTRRDGELFLASRFPIVRTTQLLSPPKEQPGFTVRYGAAAAYELLTPSGPITLVNLHLASPHEALQAMREGDESFAEQLAFNSRQREAEAAAVTDFLETVTGPAVVAGDFNTPRESPVFRKNFGNLQNAFSEKGRGFGMTHVSRTSSVRIDHVLVTRDLDVRECWLAEAAGSPHRPMITDVVPELTATLKSVSTEP
jgi:endonuclease/exonuclease/phosphatase (EEP) superfamily protein YafD